MKIKTLLIVLFVGLIIILAVFGILTVMCNGCDFGNFGCYSDCIDDLQYAVN